MKWGLSQGMIGRKHESLSPSFAALGPNTYLSQSDFLKMLGAALAVHLLIFGIAGLFPGPKVTNIPVRALSFKLGDQDRVAAYGNPSGVGVTFDAPPIAAPVMRSIAADTGRVNPVAAVPKPVKPAKIAAVRPVPQVTPPAPEPAAYAPPVPTPAIAPTPQQYVREVSQPPAAAPAPAAASGAGTPTGAIGGAGMESTMTEKTQQEIRERYEQQISGWIERHKFYPPEAGGHEGRVIVRMRIDRAGAVRYYALEQSSGIAAIDAAAVDMVRRANPVPAVPANYPAGNLIEFLIPITFHAPQ